MTTQNTPDVLALFPYTPAQRKWIDTLRTTRLAQTKGNLHNEDGFCCLGIACESLGLLGVQPEIDDEGHLCERFYYLNSDEVLPEEAVEMLNLRGTIGEFEVPVKFDEMEGTCLAHLNDVLKWTFAQIADFIEQNPTLVFTNLDL